MAGPGRLRYLAVAPFLPLLRSQRGYIPEKTGYIPAYPEGREMF